MVQINIFGHLRPDLGVPHVAAKLFLPLINPWRLRIKTDNDVEITVKSMFEVTGVECCRAEGLLSMI